MFFLSLLVFVSYRSCRAVSISLKDWCNDGCNVISNGLNNTYHCLQEQNVRLSSSDYLSLLTPQCLYHDISYNISSSNITLKTFPVNNGTLTDHIFLYT